jgi:hypothetical protein
MTIGQELVSMSNWDDEMMDIGSSVLKDEDGKLIMTRTKWERELLIDF